MVPSPPHVEFKKQIELLDRGWVQEFDMENKMEEMYAFSFKLRKGRQQELMGIQWNSGRIYRKERDKILTKVTNTIYGTRNFPTAWKTSSLHMGR
jgi:hypothetical protein